MKLIPELIVSFWHLERTIMEELVCSDYPIPVSLELSRKLSVNSLALLDRFFFFCIWVGEKRDTNTGDLAAPD